MNFKIGDKVVFITNADAYFAKFDFMKKLSNDEIYVVRGLDGHGSDGIYLEGIYNMHCNGCEISYGNKDFRKVQDFGEQVLERIEKEIEEELAITQEI